MNEAHIPGKYAGEGVNFALYPDNNFNPFSSPGVTEIIKCNVFSFGASRI
jgi:hypothetical protein